MTGDIATIMQFHQLFWPEDLMKVISEDLEVRDVYQYVLKSIGKHRYSIFPTLSLVDDVVETGLYAENVVTWDIMKSLGGDVEPIGIRHLHK